MKKISMRASRYELTKYILSMGNNKLTQEIIFNIHDFFDQPPTIIFNCEPVHYYIMRDGEIYETHYNK